MTRMQILVDKQEIQALRRQSVESGKSYSQLVREAIDDVYVSRFSDVEMEKIGRAHV